MAGKVYKRNCLSLRAPTTTAQKDPAFFINKVVTYVLQVRRLTESHHYTPQLVIYCPEQLLMQLVQERFV